MQKILFLKGLPASGKSTFAKEFCELNSEFRRLNKDEIRIELGNEPYSREFEDKVLNVQRERGLDYIRNGFSIVIDDTNFAPKHENFWRQIASERGLEFEEKLFYTSVTECIRRDEQRENSVGRDVIISMYQNMVVKGKTQISLDRYMDLLRMEEIMTRMYALYQEVLDDKDEKMGLDDIGERYLINMGYYG